MDELANILGSESSGAVFTGETDPQLAADALPFTMKLYELILEKQPDNPNLNFVTGRNFILYANAFLHMPASMLPDEEWEENEELMRRAKALYLRGRDYGLKSLELTHPGFAAALEEPDLDPLLNRLTPQDVPRLYWVSSAWLGAFSCDPFDLEISAALHRPLALLLRALSLEETYDLGAIHGVLIQVYTALPQGHLARALEGSPTILRPFLDEYYGDTPLNNRNRALHHFEKAVAISGGSSPSPFISLAEGLAVKEQDLSRFTSLLESALAIEASSFPKRRLEILIRQEKARWLLDNSENFFLPDIEEPYE